uniref:Uncharacterized protein n=1 Tax=Cacopsylla melanoneura TaxID=428564 RepID=A0A8D8UUG8_9HEMI
MYNYLSIYKYSFNFGLVRPTPSLLCLQITISCVMFTPEFFFSFYFVSRLNFLSVYLPFYAMPFLNLYPSMCEFYFNFVIFFIAIYLLLCNTKYKYSESLLYR